MACVRKRVKSKKGSTKQSSLKHFSKLHKSSRKHRKQRGGRRSGRFKEGLKNFLKGNLVSSLGKLSTLAPFPLNVPYLFASKKLGARFNKK